MFEQMEKEDKVYGNLLNGEWVASASGETIGIYSPIDGSLLGSVQAMTREEVDQAVASTKDYIPAWSALPVYERAEIFYQAADLLEQSAQKIADLLVMEVAKEKKSALSEVTRSADLLRYTADIGKSLEGQAISGENFPGGSRSKISYVERVP